MINLFVNTVLMDLSDDFDLLITRSIADIKNPEQRTSDWSKTVVLPGTKANNVLFGNIFEVDHTVLGNGQFSPNFNPNKKADVLVLVDGFEQLRGFIRLIQINVLDNDTIEYECSLHGQTADLFTTLGNAKLSELNFDEYNHVLNLANVTNSWDTSIIKNNTSQAFALGEGYVYAQMLSKYGSQNNNTSQWRVDDHVPSLYAKTILDKIMSKTGYQYTSDSFFNTERFKRLVIPYNNFGFEANETELTTRLFQASNTTNITITSFGQTLAFNNDSTGGNFDNGGNYNNSTYKFVSPVTANYDFYLSIKGTASIASGLLTAETSRLGFGAYKNGVLIRTIYIASTNSVVNNWLFDSRSYESFECLQGDEIQIKFIEFSGRNFYNVSSTLSLDANQNFFYNHIDSAKFGYNNILDFALFFAGDDLQKDMLSNFVKMFNLYIEQDILNPKLLRFVPRDDFYNGSTKDWTKKLDYSQNVTIVPMGNLEANPYTFTFKEGQDQYNKDYKQSTARIYGDRVIRVDNDFVKEEKKIEVTFAPTILFQADDSKRYYSYIFNSNNDKGQLRCLYFGGVKTTPIYEVYETNPTNTPNFTKYPLTLHIDDVDNMQFDLNFGMPLNVISGKGLSYSNQNLVNVYWYKTIKEITDKNSKILRAYFRITPYDWYTLQFKDLYFFEGQYWRLNKISDYNPLQNGVYLCEFLLVTYYQPTTATKKNVGIGSIDVLSDKFPKGIPIGFTGVGSGGINIGNSHLDSLDTVVIGNDNVSGARYSTLIGERINIPNGFEYVTAINCTDFTAVESNKVYMDNFPQQGAYSCGGNVIEINATNSPYTCVYDDYLIVCDMTANISIVLPNPSTNQGKIFVVKKLGNPHRITVTAGDGSILIDTSTSHTILNDRQAHQFISTGTQYYIIVP
jgi:hypothetical protein